MAKEDWRQCVDWLVRCQVLTPDHKVASSEAQVYDLAVLIRDGVLLCHLLNRLQVASIDPKDFSQRPQMSQFLCLKNIRTFLYTCRNTFGLKDIELFEPNDLFDVKDFGKVINTLSVLSCSPKAQKSNIHGFKTRSREDYVSLQTMAENGRSAEEDVYNPAAYPEDEIYEDLCSLRRRVSTQEVAPVTKRDYCIKELVETEKNYLDALSMIIECFIKKLKHRITDSDSEVIFGGIESLHTIHVGFSSDLQKACSSRHSNFNSSNSQLTIADCFIKWKEKFLAYGQFCSNLPKAQALLDKLMHNQATQQHLMECQREANGGKFRLRDLLAVPMQRVLKYHLILKELVKNTDNLHPERKSLQRALDEMQDLSVYVNEVKRDNENLQTIEEIEHSIIDLEMPENTHLKDYGRLQKDGELRMRRANEKKDRQFTLFLFDKVLLICKSRGDSYTYKDAFILSHYDVEEVPPKEKDRFIYQLIEKSTREVATFIAKTLDIRTKWLQALHTAQDNACPANSLTENHEFIMANFTEPTICDVCRKLLRGVFYQGYRCVRTGMVVHKSCLEKAKDVPGPPVIPPKKDRQVPSTPIPNAIRHPKGKVKAVATYQGIPAPPGGQPFITFEANDVFSLLSNDDSSWWEGRVLGREGLFPKNFVIVQQLNRHSFLSPSSDDGCDSPAGSPAHPLSPSGSLPPPLVSRTASTHSSFNAQADLLIDDYSPFPWFVGELNREQATRMMEQLPDGTFLIRVSNTGNRKGEYALSIRYGSVNPVKHIKVQRNGDGLYFLVDCKMFRGIPELVQYYQMNSLERSFPEVPIVLGAGYKEVLS